MARFEAWCLIAEREYTVIDQSTNWSRVWNCLKWCKLFIGIVLVIFNLFWFLHLFLDLLIPSIFNVYITSFFNVVLEWLIGVSVEFIAAILFILLSFYMMLSAYKGNNKFGLRCFCMSFYPMSPNETFMNAFYFNAIMANIWGMSMLQFMCMCF